MLRSEYSLSTKAAASVVYDYLADLRHHAHWRADVITCEIESGEPGQDGTIYRQHVHQGPGTAWRRIQARTGPGLEVAFRTLGNGTIRASGAARIRALPDGTTLIRSEIEIAFRGPGNLLRPVIASELSRRSRAYAKALKAELDGCAGMGRPALSPASSGNRPRPPGRGNPIG